MVNDRGARRARDTPASPGTAVPDPDNDPSILPSRGRQSFGQHAGAFVRELLAVVIGAVIVASLLRGFVGQMFIIPSISMQNTLQIDDRVVVEKLSSIKRGQVVVFANPGGWLSGVVPTERGPLGQALEFVGVLPDTSTEHLIKRAVGMPGDHVVCCDARGRITVNGHALDETYLYPGDAPSRDPFDIVVPPGRLWVMGDHRADSADSRDHLGDPGGGTVPVGKVIGRAEWIAWPPGHWTRLRRPAAFSGVPAHPAGSHG